MSTTAKLWTLQSLGLLTPFLDSPSLRLKVLNLQPKVGHRLGRERHIFVVRSWFYVLAIVLTVMDIWELLNLHRCGTLINDNVGNVVLLLLGVVSNHVSE